ncbi:hypothetical protein D3C73_1384710 [compost metagenome]
MRKRIGLAVHRYIPFLHDLKQRRLRLGRSPVNFVGQQNVSHDRTGPEMEHFITGMIYGYSGNITWQNIRIALNPPVIAGHGS